MNANQKKEIHNIRKALYAFYQASMQLVESWDMLGNYCTPAQRDAAEDAMSSSYPFDLSFDEMDCKISTWFYAADSALTVLETGAAEVDPAHVEQVLNEHTAAALEELCKEYGLQGGPCSLDWGHPDEGDAEHGFQDLCRAYTEVLRKSMYWK